MRLRFQVLRLSALRRNDFSKASSASSRLCCSFCASGVVAGYWAEQRAADPGTTAERVLLHFNELANSYAPALRTPSFAVDGTWERA